MMETTLFYTVYNLYTVHSLVKDCTGSLRENFLILFFFNVFFIKKIRLIVQLEMHVSLYNH